METDESTVSHGRKIVLKETTFMTTVLMYHLGLELNRITEPKWPLFHECPQKMISLVLHSGVPKGGNRCMVTLKQFDLETILILPLHIK